ncbi:hypothetical protein N9406_08180 [Verrucomicrobiales bacterium]|nr:hypothetical protein [Verrucomicrobiales bacterium]MDB2642256.1 hypothetical protein [bacterium]MDB3940931.1 hypothetical protein [Verrucomicrobiales bacterium]
MEARGAAAPEEEVREIAVPKVTALKIETRVVVRVAAIEAVAGDLVSRN